MVIRLDYATFNFSAGKMSTNIVGDTLLGDNSLMRWYSKGNSGENSLVISPNGCSWLPNSGFDQRPHRLQVSGLGCHNFAYTLPSLVSACTNQGGEVSFSRLDFAFDVLISRESWRDFISSAFASSLHSDRKAKKYSLAGSGEAMTIYIGSRVSPRYFRIYNKTLEDKDYKYFEDGKLVDVPDDMCVVRYEVELKRKLWNREGKKVVFDPSPYFYDYYSCEQSLADMIHDLWLSFGDDVLLPPGFANEKLELLSKNFYFAQLSQSSAIEVTEDRVIHSPYSFDRVKNYVIEKFGQYIPFICANQVDFEICLDKCKSRIGFVPDFDVHSSGFIDIDDSDDIDLPWGAEIIDDFTQCNINLDIGGDTDDFET